MTIASTTGWDRSCQASDVQRKNGKRCNRYGASGITVFRGPLSTTVAVSARVLAAGPTQILRCRSGRACMQSTKSQGAGLNFMKSIGIISASQESADAICATSILKPCQPSKLTRWLLAVAHQRSSPRLGAESTSPALAAAHLSGPELCTTPAATTKLWPVAAVALRSRRLMQLPVWMRAGESGPHPRAVKFRATGGLRQGAPCTLAAGSAARAAHGDTAACRVRLAG